MEDLPLDCDGRFDLHGARHGLKLLKDTGETTLLRNERGYACPACGKKFSGLYLSKRRENSFNPDSARRFCVLLEDDRFLMMTH